MKTQPLFCSKLLLALLVITSQAEAQDRRPNLIYIMVDDMGYADLSAYGRKDYQTPVLDKLAQAGMKFTQAYSAASMCTPTRVAFMTGRYPARNPIGVIEPLTVHPEHMKVGLDSSLPTISSLLKKAGYETALIGKWHLGFARDYLPGRHGFDYFFGITSGAADYVDHRYAKDLVILYEQDEPVEREGYLTDIIADEAIEFISKNRAAPFFLSLQFNAPHWPWQGPGDPAYAPEAGFTSGGSAETFARMVKSLDDNIGRVMEALKATGLSENTLVIFTSDNGGERYSDMGPLTGKKMQLWEGGIRVPAFAVWPGQIESGVTTDQVAVTMDWTVTLLSAAGVRAMPYRMDGIDLLPVLKGGKVVNNRTLYWRMTQRAQHAALREGSWKYLKTEKGEFLFNVESDVGEKQDLRGSNLDLFSRLKAKWESMNASMLSPVPLLDD